MSNLHHLQTVRKMWTAPKPDIRIQTFSDSLPWRETWCFESWEGNQNPKAIQYAIDNGVEVHRRDSNGYIRLLAEKRRGETV